MKDKSLEKIIIIGALSVGAQEVDIEVNVNGAGQVEKLTARFTVDKKSFLEVIKSDGQ